MTPALRNACLADGSTRLVGLADRAYLKDDAARQQWLSDLVVVLDSIRSARQSAYIQQKWRDTVRASVAPVFSAATMADLDAYIGIV